MATKGLPPRSGYNAPLATAETANYQARSQDVGAGRSDIGATRAPIGEAETVRQLQALARGAKQRERLSAALAKGAIPSRKGLGTPEGAAGIASPLIEEDYLRRTYYDPQPFYSSDGLF